MELSPRTLAGVVLLLGGGFATLLSASVLTFFHIIQLAGALDCAIVAVVLMLTGLALAFSVSLHNPDKIHPRRDPL